MSRPAPTRREFVRLSAGGLVSLSALRFRGGQSQRDGRLRSRPATPIASATPGTQPLGFATGRDGLWLVPASYRPSTPAPLILSLHGATGSGRPALEAWRDVAESHGAIVLAPDSRDYTWDVVRGGFGPDVAFIDRALAEVFRRCTVDPNRLFISGFSDGASYAISLGLINGDLFRRIVAFSPGFIVPGEWTGAPECFVSHGTADPILPIDAAGRRVATMLRRGGYSVRYREFNGGHTVPAEIRAEAVGWMFG